MRSCSVEGCESKYRSKGYCTKHYARFRTHGNPLISLLNSDNDGKCAVDGCKGKYFGNGYCSKHNYRFTKYGDPLMAKYNRDTERKCLVSGCEGRHYSTSGYCKAHYMETDEWKKKRATMSHKRRATKRNAPLNDFTEADWKSSLKHFNNECAYCGCIDKKIHQEHVVPMSKGGSNTIRNIVPACETCNLKKKNSLIEQWFHKQSFHSKEREDKIYQWLGYKKHKSVLQTTLF